MRVKVMLIFQRSDMPLFRTLLLASLFHAHVSVSGDCASRTCTVAANTPGDAGSPDPCWMGWRGERFPSDRALQHSDRGNLFISSDI